MSLLPWNKKPEKRSHVPRSLKQKEAKAHYDQVKAESDIYVQGINLAKKDDEWVKQFTAKKLGIPMPQTQSVIDKKRNELLEKMMEGFDFGDDEELNERFREYMFSKLTEEPLDGHSRRRRGGNSSGISLREQMEDFKTMASEMGYKENKGNWLSSIAEIMAALPQALPLIMQLSQNQQAQQLAAQAGQPMQIEAPRIIPQARPQAPLPHIPVVEPTGNQAERELTPAEYQAWQAQQKAKAQAVQAEAARVAERVAEQARAAARAESEQRAIAAMRAMPVEAPPAPVSVAPAQEEKKVEVSRSYVISVGEAEFKSAGEGSMGLASWIPWLDRDPEEFVQELQGKRDQGDSSAKFVLDMLKASSGSGQILAMLAAYKNDPEYGPIIQRLEARRDWVDAVIVCAKESSEI